MPVPRPWLGIAWISTPVPHIWYGGHLDSDVCRTILAFFQIWYGGHLDPDVSRVPWVGLWSNLGTDIDQKGHQK